MYFLGLFFLLCGALFFIPILIPFLIIIGIAGVMSIVFSEIIIALCFSILFALIIEGIKLLFNPAFWIICILAVLLLHYV